LDRPAGRYDCSLLDEPPRSFPLPDLPHTPRAQAKILGWLGFQVCTYEVDEAAKALTLWVRRKRGARKLICSCCGRHCGEIHETGERTVRDLPSLEYRATVIVELHRVRCPACGPRVEKVTQLPGKAPFSKGFKEEAGEACMMIAAARQVARRTGLAESTVRAIDLRCLERWDAGWRNPALWRLGVDEIYRGKKSKFLTVVCNLATGEPLWFGRDQHQIHFRPHCRHGLIRAPLHRSAALPACELSMIVASWSIVAIL
jgi:transposase